MTSPTTTEAVDGPRWCPSALVSMLVMLGTLAALGVMVVTGQPGELGQRLHDEFSRWWIYLVSIQFLVLTPAMFLLEYLFPAQPEHRTIGPSVGFDLLYFVVHLPFISALGAFMAGPIVRFLEADASWLVIDSTDGLPMWLMGIVGVAIVDFGAFYAHWIKHKVPMFWRFHMIHHSQPRMSMFTANRTHPIDALIDVFATLPLLFALFPSFVGNIGNVFVLTLVHGWLARFEHANIRTNLGPLRWVLVTPQSHRIHHSTEPEHWNSNYATFFAWDRLFGTQHPDVASYPRTGINDPYHPEPTSWSPADFAKSFVGQMLFPFDTAAVKRASVGSPNGRAETSSS